MGRKSSISRLPPVVRQAVDEALKTGRHTIDEIRDGLIEEFGPNAAPSRSAIGRYAQRFEEVGKRMRESREVAGVWADRLGKEPSGDIGKLVMDLLRTLAFDATLEMSEREEGDDGVLPPVNAKALNQLALAVHRLETAGRHNLEREQAMRKAVLEEAAKAGADIAKKTGMSAATQDLIKREILGIGASA